MYKIFTSLWSTKTSSSQIDNQIPFESETFIDEDDWVFIAPKIKSIDQTIPTSIITQHFNPIENLLIEHASMSVYEQIAFRTRHRKTFDELKIDDNEEITDNNQTSTVFQYQSQYPIDQQNVNISLIDSTTNRHINRIQQRRKRSIKNTHIDKSIYLFNKTLERQRFNSIRTPKFILHQPSFRSNH